MKETAASSLAATMSASEILEQREQLNRDRKAFYEDLTEFEDRKHQLAKLEWQLNKQVCVCVIQTIVSVYL